MPQPTDEQMRLIAASVAKGQQPPPAQPQEDSGWSTTLRAIDMALGTVLSNAGPNMAAGIATPTSTIANDVLKARQLRSNVAAGPLALPGQAAAAVELARKGVPAVVSGVMSDDNKPVYSRIADQFMQNILPEESQAKLAGVMHQHLLDYARSNPKATQEDIAKEHERYNNSDEFHQQLNAELPTGLRWNAANQQWANDVAGVGKRGDEMSAGDEAIQMISSALVGAPEAMVSKAIKPIVAAVGERVAKSIPARVAARAVEAITPATLPLTPGNVAMNAGVGVGINEAIRGMGGQDTLVPWHDLIYDPTKDTPDAGKVGVATGISAGILFGVPGMEGKVAKELADDTEHAVATGIKDTVGAAVDKATGAVDYAPPTAGKTLANQSTSMSPTMGVTRGWADENAPLKVTMQNAGGGIDDVQWTDALASTAGTANRVEMTNNALNYGIFEGMSNRSPAFVDMEKLFKQLKPEDQIAFDNYFYAKQRASNTKAYMKSLDEQINEATNEIAIAKIHGHKGKQDLAEKTLQELQTKRVGVEAEAPEHRSMMQDWTKEQVADYINKGDMNPALQPLIAAMKKGSADSLQFQRMHGMIDDAAHTRLSETRDIHGTVQQREGAEFEKGGKYEGSGPLKRRYIMFKDKFMPEAKPSDDIFNFNTAQRNVTGEGSHVNHPLPAMEAYKKHIIDTVRNVGVNNARKDYIRRLDSFEGARGKFLKPHEFDLGNGRKVTSISPAQYSQLPAGAKLDESKYTKFYDNGKLEFWEWADEQNRHAMDFAPTAAIPIANATRKMYQFGTTGLGAPWFAVRNLAWDTPTAALTKNAGRSLGLIDTAARKMAHGTNFEAPINALFDHAFDPTAYAATVLAIPKQLNLRASRALGEKIADDLINKSGVFNHIASISPAAKEWINGLGTQMARDFDNSALGVMSRNMSTSLQHLNDVTQVVSDYTKAGSHLTGAKQALWNSYKAGLESIHGATKYAFFESNYGRLLQQYEGKIPQSEINKLVQETRNLTGDMSRRSGNKNIQRAASVVPYLNATIQGTRHVLHSAIPREADAALSKVGVNVIREQNTRFWSQFVTGLAIPTIGALTLMSKWPGAEDYWYNQVPAWKRLTGIPYPNPSALLEMVETGKLPEFSSDKINIIPIPPELAMILHPAIEGMRYAGILGTPQYSTPQPFLGSVKDVMDQVTSISTPPLLQMAAAWSNQRFDINKMISGQGMTSDIQDTGAGANADKMTTNSMIPNYVYNMVGALLGTAPQIAVQTFNVFDLARKDGQGYVDAAKQAYDTGSFETLRRLPEMDTGLWNARERRYSYTPEAQYVSKVKDDLDPIIGQSRQLSVERDAKNQQLGQAAGYKTAENISSPLLKNISLMVSDAMNKKGAYKTAADAYTAYRKQLINLENSRQRFSDDSYNKQRNLLVKKQQEATRTQSQVLQTMERQLDEAVGTQFQQQYGVPFSYRNLGKLVKQDTEN